MNQYPGMMGGGPYEKIVNFLAFVGLLTIFGIGILIGMVLVQLY